MCLWNLRLPDKNKICKKSLSICCRRFLCIYSIPGFRRVIQLFLIFCMFIKALYLLLFRWLCPHPASGIRPKFFGNHTDADGIRVGWFVWMIAIPPFTLQVFRDSFAVQNNQLVQYLIPVSISLRPFFYYILTGQI